MGKTWGSNQNKDPKPTAKYYLYEDGHSNWGLGLNRTEQRPIECTEDQHRMTIEEKIQLFNEMKQEMIRAEEEALKKKK